MSHFKSTFKAKHYIVVLVGIAILVIMTLLNGGDKHTGETLSLSTSLIIKYYIAGICASSAMLLPGISGSFMLLIFGAYGTVMYAISQLVKFNFNALPILLIVGLGILTGFLVSSKLIQYLLHHHTTMTFALIIGFVIGSIFAVYPGLPKSALTWIISIVTLIVGFIVSYVLGQITAKMKNKYKIRLSNTNVDESLLIINNYSLLPLTLSITLFTASFTLPEALSSLPSFSRFSLSVTLPTVSFTLPFACSNLSSAMMNSS